MSCSITKYHSVTSCKPGTGNAGEDKVYAERVQVPTGGPRS